MRTPLYDCHVAAGGRMVDFAGWELPVQYGGILEEHNAVRTRAGLFDVSHMGEILVSGVGAYDFLQSLLTNDIARLQAGRAVYAPLCNEQGGTVDDLIVYPYGEDYLVVVNASNTDKDFAWIAARAPKAILVDNVSAQYAQLALQGPEAHALLTAIGGAEAAALPFFGCGTFAVSGKTLFISATGYTGEKGFELYLNPEDAPFFWDALVNAGVVPCGLGARDTLRMEAALPLYGHELSETIAPLSAGLARFVKCNHAFVGRDALQTLDASGAYPRLIGLSLQGRAIPRAGYRVFCGHEDVGIVTSGGPSPSTGQKIAMALVNPSAHGEWFVEIRGKREPAQRVDLPFYKRS